MYIEELTTMPTQVPLECERNQHEIPYRQQLFLLSVNPFGSLMVLALGAAPVTAGKRFPFRMIAVRAFHVQLA